MEAILKGSSQRGWKTTTSTVNDPSPCSLHSTSKESQNSSFPSLRICWPIVTDTASLATSRCPAFLDVREFGFEVALLLLKTLARRHLARCHCVFCAIRHWYQSNTITPTFSAFCRCAVRRANSYCPASVPLPPASTVVVAG